MKRNMKQDEQYIRIIIAFYIFALMHMKTGGNKKFLAPLGLMFLLTGLSGYCPSYDMLDMFS